MISTWTLKCFKSVYEQTDLQMAPLTIFAGANSSGKSTVIQSLLLTAQTLQSPVQSRPVVLNGHIQRLGAFDDVVSNSSTSESILIGFKLIPDEKEKKGVISSISSPVFAPSHIIRISNFIASVECHFKFSSQGPTQNRDVLQLQPRLEECRIKSNYEFDNRVSEDEIFIRRSKVDIKSRLLQLKLKEEFLSLADLSSLEFEIIKPDKVRNLHTAFLF